MSLDRSALLAALARQIVEVDVPEIGGAVHFREMSVRERVEFNKRCFGEDGKGTISPQGWALALVAASVCDADGNPLLSEDDAAALWDQSETKLGALARHAERVNGLGPAAIVDAEKNSKRTAKNTPASN